jgi:hypothetical protein
VLETRPHLGVLLLPEQIVARHPRRSRGGDLVCEKVQVRRQFHAVQGFPHSRRLAPRNAVGLVRVRRALPVPPLAVVVAVPRVAALRADHVVHVELAAAHALAELLQNSDGGFVSRSGAELEVTLSQRLAPLYAATPTRASSAPMRS